MEAIVTRFTTALERAIDGIEAVARAGNGLGAVGDGEALAAFEGRVSDIEDQLRFCERTLEKSGSPSLRDLVEIGRRKADANEDLLNVHGVTLRHAGEISLPENGNDRENKGFDCDSFSEGPLIPTPLPRKKRESILLQSAGCESDPPTPTLEDFGLDAQQPEISASPSSAGGGQGDWVEENCTTSRSIIEEEEDSNFFIIEDDLDAMPTYLQNQVDANSLNQILARANGTDFLTIEDIAQVVGERGCKASILVLLQLKRLKSIGQGRYALPT